MSDWSLIEYDIKEQNRISPNNLAFILRWSLRNFILRCLQQSLNFFYIKQWKEDFFYDPLFDKKYNTLGWNKGDFSADGRFAYFDPVANFFATSSSSKHLLEIYVSHFLVSSSSAFFFIFSFCCYHKCLKRHKRLKNEHE